MLMKQLFQAYMWNWRIHVHHVQHVHSKHLKMQRKTGLSSRRRRGGLQGERSLSHWIFRLPEWRVHPSKFWVAYTIFSIDLFGWRNQEKQVCNYHFDCKDKSDELQCMAKSASKKCPPNKFACGDGTCIGDRFVCDGMIDCADHSDENNCLENVCTFSQFRSVHLNLHRWNWVTEYCRCDSGECIPKSWECDHEYDCKDLSDEHADCGKLF